MDARCANRLAFRWVRFKRAISALIEHARFPVTSGHRRLGKLFTILNFGANYAPETWCRLDIYSNKHPLGPFKFTGNLRSRPEDPSTLQQPRQGGSLHCLYEGDDLEIGFNVSLMTDIIASVRAEDDMIVDGPSTGLMRRRNGTCQALRTKRDTMLMLLMPVMLTSCER